MVVTAEQLQAEALEARFRRRLPDTLSFRHVPSVPEALSEMRTELPDVVIGARETHGVGGLELLRRLRGDSQLGGVAFILLDEAARSQFSPSRLEAVLGAAAHPADVLEAAFSLLVVNGRYQEPRAFHGAFSPPLGGPSLEHVAGQRGQAGQAGKSVKVSGSLEVMSLFDLVALFTQKSNSGRFYLLLGKDETLLVFQQGRLVHAEYKALTGEAAVLQVFLAAERHPDAEFFFEPSDVQLSPEGVTLHASVEELLLKVAVELDHQHRLSPKG